MFKRIFIMLAIIVAAVQLAAAPKVKIDRSSSSKVVETLLLAICENDRDAIWELMITENKQTFIMAMGSEAKAKEKVWEMFSSAIPKEKIAEIKTLLAAPETKAKIVGELERGLSKGITKKDDQWFLDFSNYAKHQNKQPMPPASKWQVDQSSKEGVIATFLRASADRDINAIWQIMPPAVKASGIVECGSEAKAKEVIVRTIISSLSDEEANNIKNIFANPEIAQKMINSLLVPMEKGLLNIDGKWYIDPSKFNQE